MACLLLTKQIKSAVKTTIKVDGWIIFEAIRMMRALSSI
jgi:hypothetical protein